MCRETNLNLCGVFLLPNGACRIKPAGSILGEAVVYSYGQEEFSILRFYLDICGSIIKQ